MKIRMLSKKTNNFYLFVFGVLFFLVNTQYSIAGLKEQYYKKAPCTSRNAEYFENSLMYNNNVSLYTDVFNKDGFLCIKNNQIFSERKNQPAEIVGYLNTIFYYETNDVMVDWRIEKNLLVAYICDADKIKKNCKDLNKITRLEMGVKR